MVDSVYTVPHSSSELHWWRPHLPQSECLLWGKTQSDPWWSEAAACWSKEGEETKLLQWLSRDNTNTQWEREIERTGEKKALYTLINWYTLIHWFLSATVDLIYISLEMEDNFFKWLAIKFSNLRSLIWPQNQRV